MTAAVGVEGAPGRASAPAVVALPRHHVPRPRLTSLLEGARLAAIVAGGGYGKTVLASEHARLLGVAAALVRLEPGDDEPGLVIARARRALLRSRLSDAAGALSRSGADHDAALEALLDHLAATREPLVLVVDEIQNAGDASGLLVRLARDLPHPHRLVLAGRALPGPAAPLAAEPDVLRLGAADLAFTTAEAAVLVRLVGNRDVSESDAARLVELTAGWPSALVVAADRIARGSGGPPLLAGVDGRRALLAGLVADQLARLDDATAAGLVQLAHLPPLPAEEVDGVLQTLGVHEQATAAGVPVEIGPDRELDLPGPIREALAARAPLDPGVAARAAEVLSRRGGIAEAVRLLLGARDVEGAADVLAGLPDSDAGLLDFEELRALVVAVGPPVDRRPRALLHLARACEAAAQARVRADALDRARLGAAGDEALTREIDAELARDLIRDGRVDEAAALAERLLGEASTEELQTRVRALHVLGRTYAWRADPASLASAEPLLEEAAELYERLGYATGSAHARLALAYDVQTLGGRFDDAVRSLERALAVLPARARLRGVVLTFHGEALVDLGRYDDAEASLAEAGRLGRELGDARTIAYAAWVRARIAARRGDRAAVHDLLAQAEASRGDWFDHHSGAEFLAEAAVLLDETGDVEAADARLARALEREQEAPRYVRLATGTIAARRRDPADAERILAEVAEMPDLEVRERWRVALLRAWAARRAGDDDRAAALARDAFDQAAAAGYPQLPLIREPRLAAELAGLAAAAGSEAAATLTPGVLPVHVRALGGLAVVRGGVALALPPGRPALLVALLAARGGQTAAEEAIDALWPGVDAESGRKRLRNVLNRLRTAAGDLVVRAGEMLVFAEGAEIDAARFEADALAALSEPSGAAAEGRARAALARYTGPLLPEARYDEWAAEPRERLERRFLALLDHLAARAQARGDADEAIRLLERAIAVDRFDEGRYLEAARLLLAQNRRGRALATLRSAAGALRELGLEPSPAHRELVRSARA